MENHTELLTVLKELHNISGLRLSIYDTHFHEMVAWPPDHCSFCAELQRNECALQMCKESDKNAFEKAKETGEMVFYRCRFGMNEAVAPLFSFGNLIGYLMMGQNLCAPENIREEVWAASRSYAIDEKALWSRLYEQPLQDPNKMLSCMHIMDICAKYISMRNRFNPDKSDLPAAVRSYIHRNFREQLSLEHLRSVFFCSRATLINTFRERYGEGINQCITRVRVEHAQKMLEYSRQSINKISTECGFSNQNYFTKVFRKKTGMTPTEYRKALWGKEGASDAVEECADSE
jgi:AraC-like DNA-binding protein